MVGITMLARRELSTTQVRTRLEKKGFNAQESDSAIRRLQAEGALNDRRTALASARQALTLKLQGPRRALKEIQRLGIDRQVAQNAVNEVYATIDERQLIREILSKRLDGPVSSQAEFRRLYNLLIRRGFDSTAAVSALKTHNTKSVAFD